MTERFTGENREQQPDDNTISRLSAVIRVGYNDHVFLGWSDLGLPALQRDPSHLSEEARSSFENSSPIEWSNLRRFSEIIPVEFTAVGQAVDRQHGQQDKIQIALTNGSGELETPLFDEMDLLDGIVDRIAQWEEVNIDASPSEEEIIPSTQMYTMFLPVPSTRSGTPDKLYAVMFQPPYNAISNGITLKLYLENLLQTLKKLDERQPAHLQKGYIKAIESSANMGTSGDAFGAMMILRGLGVIKTSEDKMEEIRRRSASVRGNFGKQMRILGEELGAIKKPKKSLLAQIDEEIVELRRVYAHARSLVRSSHR